MGWGYYHHQSPYVTELASHTKKPQKKAKTIGGSPPPPMPHLKSPIYIIQWDETEGGLSAYSWLDLQVEFNIRGLGNRFFFFFFFSLSKGILSIYFQDRNVHSQKKKNNNMSSTWNWYIQLPEQNLPNILRSKMGRLTIHLNICNTALYWVGITIVCKL